MVFGNRPNIDELLHSVLVRHVTIQNLIQMTSPLALLYGLLSMPGYNIERCVLLLANEKLAADPV